MQDRRALSETVDSLVIAANAGSDVDWLGRPLPAAMALKQTSAPARHCGHVPRLDFSDLLRVLMAEDFAKYCIHSTRECSEDAHPTLGFFAEEPHSTDALQRANPMLKEAVQP